MIAPPASIADENARLRAEIFWLNQQLKTLKHDIFGVEVVEDRWNLKPAERRVFLILFAKRGKWISKDALRTLLGEDLRGELRSDGALFGHVSRIRYKIAPFGWRLDGVRNLGYRLEQERAPVRRALIAQPMRLPIEAATRPRPRRALNELQGDLFQQASA